MSRSARIPVIIALACVALSAIMLRAAPAQQPEATVPDNESDGDESPQSGDESAEPAPAREPLSQEMVVLRSRMRKTLAAHFEQDFNTSENTASDVMNFCLAFGCKTQVYRQAAGGKINGIASLCWNYPCAGYRPLGVVEGRVLARVGYGYQERPSQLLAMLALSRVPGNYSIRIAEEEFSVADLVKSEKLGCRLGADMSLTLVGLSHYVRDDRTWKNASGREWSVARILRHELEQPIREAARGGTLRLTGISYALNRRMRRDQPIDGPYEDARRLIAKYQDYALELQNPDGSWHPSFFLKKGSSRSHAAQLRSTGHVLQWLVLSLPEDRLGDPRVVKAVEYVTSVLGSERYRRNVESLPSREIGSVGHALFALSLYDDRYFEPRAARRPAKETDTARTR